MHLIGNGHGGNLEHAKRLFPDISEPWLDLSTGINPYSYPVHSIRESVYHELPDLAMEERLREIAAFWYAGKSKEYIAVSPGTQILISLLPYWLHHKKICVFCPIYSEHIRNWELAGRKVHKVFNLEDFLEYANRSGRIGILCNPNNPDGRMFTSQQMHTVIQTWTGKGNQLIVDEAFMDFEGESAARFLPCPDLIVLRSFGKTYGLAGIRLGFILSDPVYIQKTRQMLGPWSVSGLAIKTAIQALQDYQWFEHVRLGLMDQKRYFIQLCMELGMQRVGGTLLFNLIQGQWAQELWMHLARKGIWVRRFDYHSGWLRFGMGQKEDWCRIKTALSSFAFVKK